MSIINSLCQGKPGHVLEKFGETKACSILTPGGCSISEEMSEVPFAGISRDDGVTVPMGPGVKTGVGKHNGYSLLYNEFVVYNPAQIRMRYLLRVKFNYASLW